MTEHSKKGVTDMTSALNLKTELMALILLLTVASAQAGRTWFVDDDQPANFTTIQAAIDAAANGDTILIRDGIYNGPGNEHISFKGKAILVPVIQMALQMHILKGL